MQYMYSNLAGNDEIYLCNDEYKYLFKVRRHLVGDILRFRNFLDNFIYLYKVVSIAKKEAVLKMIDKKEMVLTPSKYLHIGWCIIEPKEIEKTLPMLNEIGVSKISFIYCDRSQRNFKLNLQRFKKILISSSQQCGRSDMMKMEILDNLQEYFKTYPTSAVLDFGGERIGEGGFDTILIGCEGGFSKKERELFIDKKVFSFDTPLILRSQSAVVAAASIKELI